MYKKILAGTILAVSLLFTGCSGQKKQQETAQSETVPVMEGMIEENTESSEAESTDETEEVQASEIQTVIGTLEELNLEQVKLLSDNGNELTFPIGKTKIVLPSGIRIGNLIAVDYTGKITETGTNEAVAVRITGSADTITVEELESSQENRNREAGTKEETEQTKEKSLQGTIEKLSMTSITIKDDEGGKHTFSIIYVPMYFEEGLSKETKIEITYRMAEGIEEEDAEVLVIKTL